MLTAQETLLQQRIDALNALEQRVRTTQIGNYRGAQDKDALLRDIAQDRAVLSREAAIRAEYRQQAEVQNALAEHEKLKSNLRAAQKKRKLTIEDVTAYTTSRKHCEDMARAAGLVVGSPIDVQAANAQAQAKKAAAQTDYANLMRNNASLYADADTVASPCVPCMEKRLAIIVKNAEHKRRASVSRSKFSGKQKHKDTCGLMSVQSILLEKNGKAPPEGWSGKPSMWGLGNYGHLPSAAEIKHSVEGGDDMIDIGKRSGEYEPCGGTGDVAKIMSKAGIPAKTTQKPSLEQIAGALDEGKAVVVGYDARPVWQPDETKWTDTSTLGHAVRVTAVERNPDGTVRGFYINDSGSGEPGKYVPAETMQRAMDRFPHSRMSVSDSLIQPAVEEPSFQTGGVH
jgi:hypothetical protein